jgi:hypothetical protein
MTLGQIERSLDRLRSRLYRTVNAINKLEKAHRRVKRRMELEALQPKPAPEPVAVVTLPATHPTAVNIAKTEVDDLSIPAMFIRPRLNQADEAAKAGILAQQEASKKAKTAARIAKLKADKAGERSKMPLSGKAALAAINQA